MKRLKFLNAIGLCLPISILVLIGIIPENVLSQPNTVPILNSKSQPTLLDSIPTTTWNGAKLPNWVNITFNEMPGISENGSFIAPEGVQDQLGYDPSRTWSVGQTPDQYMMLGDFQDSFKLQNFSLSEISSLTGLDLSKVKLDSFGVIKLQNLGSLVKAIPSLNKVPIADITPVFDLLKSQLISPVDPAINIGQLLKQSPHLQNLEFKSLPMDSYGLDAIPGLEQTPIAAFKDWQGVKISNIPGLNKVPFNEFPNPINAVGGTVGKVDIAFGTDEQQREYTISGSHKEGFAVPCHKDCAHVELSGGANVLGKAWVSGKYQLVNGGKGFLGSVNSGKEPTGRHPFGSAFKVVVWDVSEVDGIMSQALFFRVCMRNQFVDLGCTPYFIGPVPFMTYKEKEPIFLGLITGGDESSVSTPTGLKSSGFRFKNSTNASVNKLSNLLPAIKGDCKKLHSSGTNINALSAALSSIEGNYDSVGNYVCDSFGNCGRGLGTMQFMSYRPDVRSIITSKNGGAEFLARVEKGELVTGEEMVQYISPSDQEELFAKDATTLLDLAASEIDPTTGQPFTGERLVQRAAQMHFGGSAISIDGGMSDIQGKLSVKGYGEKAAASYQGAMQLMGCS
ncbi:MAG: hypothetical protein KME46_21540 [Brasilonema angustatum HA4187-MV1]|jgi:hypothetical protein|nr:hypothetical protein [Brasilonema angustatum HA4187-MV1]